MTAPTWMVKLASADSLVAWALMSFQAVCCWLAPSDSGSLATGCDIEDADPVVAGFKAFGMSVSAKSSREPLSVNAKPIYLYWGAAT